MTFAFLLFFLAPQRIALAKLTVKVMEEARTEVRASKNSASDLPNFIVIFPDDMGWNDAYYNEGLTPYETKNMDLLAAYGTKLTTYYSAPGCVAARCAILTGRNTLRNGCHEAAGDTYWALNLNEVLIPEILKSSDYHSVLYGKWHLGYYSWQHHPMLRGFDEFQGFLGGGVGHYDHFENGLYDWWNGTNINTGAMGTYQPFIVQDLMHELIQKRSEGSLKKPFFAMLPMLLPHPEYEAPKNYSDQFADDWGEESSMSMWLSELAVLDDLVGNMFEYCYEAGILDNTYIIFAGDHSGENFSPEDVPYSRSYPFYGSKGQIWDGGIRTPAFIYNPSMSGLEITSPTSVADWLPTIAELADVASCNLPYLDGISLVTLWEDDLESNDERMLLVNVDPDCGGCDGRRRIEERLHRVEGGRKVRRRDEDMDDQNDNSADRDGESEEKDDHDHGPTAAIRYRDYKLLVSCVDWDGGINGNVYFFNLSEDIDESAATNYFAHGFNDDDMEEVFWKMLTKLQAYAEDGYPNCPEWNEGVYCPDCENECSTSQVDGYDTVRPWANCSLVYVGGGLERHYLDEDYAWECSSYCTDAYEGEIPEGVSYNRAEGSGSCPTFVPTVTPSNQPTFQPTLTPTMLPTFQPSLMPTPEPTLEPAEEIFERTFEPTSKPIRETFETTLEPTTETTNLTIEHQDNNKGGKTSIIIACTVGVSFCAVAILVFWVKNRSSYKRLDSTTLKDLQLTDKMPSRNCQVPKEKHSLIRQTDGRLTESKELYGAIPTSLYPVDYIKRNSSQDSHSVRRGETVD